MNWPKKCRIYNIIKDIAYFVEGQFKKMGYLSE